jgi:hypothetical protein
MDKAQTSNDFECLAASSEPFGFYNHVYIYIPGAPFIRRRQVPPKRRFLQEPHGVTTQKTPFFIVTAVKISNLTKYGIIFWGNSTDNKKVFEKKILRIILGIKPQNSCRDLFKTLQILPLPCEYIFSLLNFIISNQEHFQANSQC